MGEGILIYGASGQKRRYTRDLQSFADEVIRRNKNNGSLYVFGNINKAIIGVVNKIDMNGKQFL